MGSFISRLERLATVDSTQRVVRERLEAGEPEVVAAVADVQTAGRGRLGRSWQSPPGAALLVSVGLRPTWLGPRHAWRLAATVALAMLDAAEEVAGLREGDLWLKWPNDLVGSTTEGRLLKLAGVLGETLPEPGGRLVGACIGVGINVDWAAADFPSHLAASMTSLREASAGRPVDRERLLEAWLDRLEPRYEALRAGLFDAAAWSARQVTTGRDVEVEAGGRLVRGLAEGVDPDSGALLMRAEDGGAIVAVDSGEVTHCRLAPGSRSSDGPASGTSAADSPGGGVRGT